MGTDAQRTAFVRSHTQLVPVPGAPEIRLHLADDVVALWERMPAPASGADTPLPFWAAAWPGGVALARHVLDHPATVAGRTVIDVATGSGLVAIAAALAGAAAVTAADPDPDALAAVALNAAANGVQVTGAPAAPPCAHEVLLIGDACYDAVVAARTLELVDRHAACGADVLVGDPGRAHLPRARFDLVASYDVAGTAALEAGAVTRTGVWRPAPGDHRIA